MIKTIPRFDYHLHTDMSNIRVIDAINKPKELIDYAIEIGLSGICFTEHEHLGNSIIINKLQQQYKETNPDFKIAHGNEIYLTENRDKGQKYYHFILIALDECGFHMLSELSSNAWLQGYYDRGLMRVPTLYSEIEKIIKRYGKGHLYASTACIGGYCGQQILALNEAETIDNIVGRKEAHDNLVKFILWCKKTFGDNNFALEVQPGISEEQLIVNNFMSKLANVFEVPICLTSDAHFLKKEDRAIHKAFLNSKEAEREVDSFYASCWLHNQDENIEALQGTNLDYEQMCRNSIGIMSRIEDYSLLRNQEVPVAPVPDFPREDESSHKFISYPTLDKLSHSNNEQERAWVNLCYDELENKKLVNDTYLARLEEEADTQAEIGKQLGTCIFAYPLFLRHYINLIWECGSTVGTGRGSAGGGLSHWLLGITQTDPIKTKSYFWRFLNKSRKELPDIDIDLCPSKREEFLDKTREETGNLGCVHVCTYGVLSTKAAIKCAARGYTSDDYPDGIPLDEAEYLSSLIPSERGFLWSLHDCFYGNEQKGRKPNRNFIKEVNKYFGLKDILERIEGLIVQAGIHASGVIFPPKSDYYRYGPFMVAKNGMIVTQYSLHDSEAAGACKLDYLVTEVQQELVESINMLQEAGYMDSSLTLREAYYKYLAPEALPLEDDKLWDAIDSGTIMKIFQFDSQVGSQGIKLIQPRSVEELTAVNALIRLMAEDGQESPISKYVKQKNNPQLWIDEMNGYGLTTEEQNLLKQYLGESYGLCYSQEQLMLVLMDKDICGFSMEEANSARKLISKKLMDKIPELQEKVFKAAKSQALGKYVWDIVVKPSLGYSFARVHGYSYSLIACQCAYLATYYPRVYWNTACLRVDAGVEEDDSTSYDKIAKAIGNMVAHGISVRPININRSGYMFEPDEDTNSVLFGLKALNGVGGEIISDIIAKRPYSSFEDFCERSGSNKTVTLSLIKGGAFDDFGDRIEVMKKYITRVSEPKTRLTLQNFKGLMDANLLPQELNFQKRLFVFNKALRANKKAGDYYTINYNYYDFYSQFFDTDLLEPLQETVGIPCKTWQKLYTKAMEPAKNYLKEHQQEMLDKYNDTIFQEQWKKYAAGNVSSWEMDALGYYYHEHELDKVRGELYNISPYKELSSTPAVAKTFKRNGREFPIYELTRIAGTVIGKNNTKATVNILTKDSGVVTVKFSLDYFAKYNRRISEDEGGVNKVKEQGWFQKGTIVVVNGYRRGDMFVEKTYRNTKSHGLYKVTNITSDGTMTMTHLRYGEKE